MKIFFLLMLLSIPAQAGLVTTYDTSRITVNMGRNSIDGHAVLYMKGQFRVTDTMSPANFCITIDMQKLSTMQGFENMSLYNLIWYTPACSAVEGVSPCLPDGTVIFINDPWCN